MLSTEVIHTHPSAPGSLRCKFDAHDWQLTEDDSRELWRVCTRCGRIVTAPVEPAEPGAGVNPAIPLYRWP